MLRYPLQTAALTAGLLLYLQMSSLYAVNLGLLYLLEYPFLGPVIRVIALIPLLWCVLIVANMYFEYGLDIIEATAHGRPQPPALAANAVDLWNPARGRLWKHSVFVGFFAGTASQLQAAGHTALAAMLSAALLLFLPASLMMGALHWRLGALLNVRDLWQTVGSAGWYYPLAMLALLPALWLLAQGPDSNLSGFLLGTPVFLYCSFVCFHVLGLALHSNHAVFMPMADFTAERRTTDAVSDSLQQLDAVLRTAYENLRAGRTQPALDAIDLLLVAGGWQQFEQVFGYVAAWPFPAVGVHIAAGYLPHVTQRQRYMRALELLQWCVAQQADFAGVDLTTLDALAAQAATPAHYRAVLSVTENLLQQRPTLQLPTSLRHLVLEFAGTRLRDDKRHAALLARLQTTAGPTSVQ